MRYFVVLILMLSTQAFADNAESLCATNPAFAPAIMLTIIRAQLERDHDPGLDADTPENLAEKASAQGISECAAEMRSDPTIAQALTGLAPQEKQVGWDAFNTSCADHKASKGACITAEIASDRALKHMIAKNEPPASRTLVQACALVLQPDPAMAEWRECVDMGLAARPSEDRAKQCKLSASWHAAKTGEEAGKILAACLK